MACARQFAVAIGLASMLLLAATVIGAKGRAKDKPTVPVAAAEMTALARIEGLPPAVEILSHRQGFCLDLGCGDGALAAEILGKTDYCVFALARDDADCRSARQKFDAVRLYGTRATAMVGSLQSLPFPKGYGNLIVTGDYREDLNLKEVFRVLSPNGLAIVGAPKADGAKLRAAIDAAGIMKYTMAGGYAIIPGQMPEGVYDWTHVSPRPDNINTSQETLRPPFRSQWFVDAPTRIVTGESTPAAVAGGYLILRNGRNYYAWDAFNGQLLWTRNTSAEIGERYALVDGLFYGAEDDAILALKAATGQKAREYRLDEAKWAGAWKYARKSVVISSGGAFRETEKPLDVKGVVWCWLAVDNGTLYALAQTPTQEICVDGTANLLCAFDLASGQVTWKRELKVPAVCSSIAIADGSLCFYDYQPLMVGNDKLDKKGKATAFAVEAKTGAERWHADLGMVVTPGKGDVPAGGIAEGKYFVWTYEDPEGKGGGLRSFDVQTAKIRDYPAVDSTNRSGGWPVLFVGGKIYSSQHSNFTQSDVRVVYQYRCTEIDSGKEVPNGITDPQKKAGCGPGSASANCLFSGGQNQSVVDLITGKTWQQQWFRSPCPTGPLTANGMLFHFPAFCHCVYTLAAPGALAPAGVDWMPPPADKDMASRLVSGPAAGTPLVEGANEEWTHYRADPGHTGQTSVAPKMPLALGWERKLGGTLTPPSFGAGLVYVGSQDGTVWGLDQASGEVRWKHLCGAGVKVTPAYGQGRVVFGSLDGWVYCLEAKSGQLAWQFRAAPEDLYINVAGRLNSMWPCAAGVTIENGTVYAAAGTLPYDGTYLYALELKGGKALWSRRIGDPVSEEGAPGGVMALAGDTLVLPALLASHNGPVENKGGNQAYRKVDGQKLAWYPDFPPGVQAPYPRPHGTEAVADGDVFFYGGSGERDNGGSTPFVLMDLKTGWSCKAGNSVQTGIRTVKVAPADVAPVLGKRLIVGDGVAYDREKFCQALRQDAAKAKDAQLWSVPLWPGEEKQSAVSLALCGEVLLAAGESEVTAFEARDGGKELGRLKVAGRILRNSLAASGGRVFVVTQDGTVSCLSK